MSIQLFDVDCDMSSFAIGIKKSGIERGRFVHVDILYMSRFAIGIKKSGIERGRFVHVNFLCSSLAVSLDLKTSGMGEQVIATL